MLVVQFYTSPLIGFICAILSAVFNGSFTVPFKAAAAAASNSSVVDNDVHPIVFTLYVSLGVFLSSFLFAIPTLGLSYSIDLLSVVAGCLFVLGVGASFLAIDLIGMALSQGIWAGTATVVSYVWGVGIFGEVATRPILSGIALLLLVGGVCGIALCDTIAQSPVWIATTCKILFWMESSFQKDEELQPVLGDEKTQYVNETGRSTDATEATATTGETTTTRRSHSGQTTSSVQYARGIVWAWSVGLFGGSILAPTHYLPPEKQGLAVLPSFGIGCILLAPIILMIHSVFVAKRWPPWNVRHALLPGLFSGLLWNISNLLSLIAIPSIGYGIAYPLLQSAVLVSGIWGIVVFREIVDAKTIAVFTGAGGILLCGAALLTASK